MLKNENTEWPKKNVYTLAAVRWLRQCLDADGGHFEHLHWIQNSRTSLISILLLYKYSSYDYTVIFFMSKCVYIFLGHSVHYRLHKSSPPVQINPVHAPTPFYFLKIYFNTFLASMLRSSKWSPSCLLHSNPICTSPVPHTFHMRRPAHSSQFDRPIVSAEEYRQGRI